MPSKPRGRRFRRATKIAGLVLFAILFLPVLTALVRMGVECDMFTSTPPKPDTPSSPADAPSEIRQITTGLSDYQRNEDQTYLTLPEWYIVYSADEYAGFVAESRPSGFPYFGAIGQFWGSYYDVCAVTREQYSFNTGYHLSLVVIGTSFTIENILRGIYENTAGRLTEWLSGGGRTEEDAYARAVAKEYGAFLHTIPWYEFPFGAKLRGLWAETSTWGPNIIRKWERKVALSAEYGSKAVYGWLIKQATGSVYSAEDLKIQAWAKGITAKVLEGEPGVKIVREVDGQGSIATLPRYEAFTQLVPNLVAQGVEFVEIAGNDEILVTVLAPRTWNYDLDAGAFLFEMPILTQPERKRVALNVPVPALHGVLAELDRHGVELEHIYDY